MPDDLFNGMADWEISPEKRAWKDESQQMWPVYRGDGEFEFVPGVFVMLERIFWLRFRPAWEYSGDVKMVVPTW